MTSPRSRPSDAALHTGKHLHFSTWTPDMLYLNMELHFPVSLYTYLVLRVSK